LHRYSHLKIQGNRDVHEKITAPFLTDWSGWLAVVLPSVIFQNVMDPGKPYIVVFANGSMMGFWIIFFAFSVWKLNWKNYL
jgi:hypothetical protein